MLPLLAGKLGESLHGTMHLPSSACGEDQDQSTHRALALPFPGYVQKIQFTVSQRQASLAALAVVLGLDFASLSVSDHERPCRRVTGMAIARLARRERSPLPLQPVRDDLENVKVVSHLRNSEMGLTVSSGVRLFPMESLRTTGSVLSARSREVRNSADFHH